MHAYSLTGSGDVFQRAGSAQFTTWANSIRCINLQKRAMDAEQEAAKAYKQIDKLKKKNDKDISTHNKLLAKTRLPNEEIQPTLDDLLVMPICDDTKVLKNVNGQFELFCNEEDSELANLADQSWFSAYDTCNI